MKYAADTSVSVEKSRAEIENTVVRYGATGFVSGWRDREAIISFEMRDRRVRFNLPLPDLNSKEFTHTVTGKRRDVKASRAAWEQACRQRWRALALSVKAKLEAVESGIFTFEEEFLNHIVTASGLTIGEMIQPRLLEVTRTGKLPPLLPGSSNETVQGEEV